MVRIGIIVDFNSKHHTHVAMNAAIELYLRPSERTSMLTGSRRRSWRSPG